MIYKITNKPNGLKKIFGLIEGRIIVEFDKDNTAAINDKAIADRLKKVGYGVEEIKENKETKDKQSKDDA